jgi:hypothetical protein
MRECDKRNPICGRVSQQFAPVFHGTVAADGGGWWTRLSLIEVSGGRGNTTGRPERPSEIFEVKGMKMQERRRLLLARLHP